MDKLRMTGSQDAFCIFQIEWRSCVMVLLLEGTRYNGYPMLEWMHQQVLLNPFPKELMLRNHV